MINGFEPGDIEAFPTMAELLRRYADALTPWAQATARAMLGEVEQRDRETWRALGNAISAALRRELLEAPLGDTLRGLLASQVELIRSITSSRSGAWKTRGGPARSPRTSAHQVMSPKAAPC